MANDLTIWCMVDCESTSAAFKVKLSPTDDVADLRKLIKTEKPKRFANVDADELTLWKVSIPVVIAHKHENITLNSLDPKNKGDELHPTDELEDVFNGQPTKKTIHILVQLPPT
ncbi:hypothetical protein BGZ65_006591, partial [Modicella reniformis]